MRDKQHTATRIISQESTKKALAYAHRLISRPINAPSGTLRPLVKKLLTRKDTIVSLAAKKQTPFYLFDREALHESIARYSTALQKYIPRSKVFYAVKTNTYPPLLEMIRDAGFGFDVSSMREMRLCQNGTSTPMVFSGPGKTNLALRAAAREKNVTILLDSFGELKRLSTVKLPKGARVRAGVRIHINDGSGWSKFGIPLTELASFWNAAAAYPSLNLCGIQFHQSHNESAAPYIQTLKALAETIKKDLLPTQRRHIVFLDCGGGFLPYRSEGLYPDATPPGIVIKEAFASQGASAPFQIPHVLLNSISVENYFRDIAAALKKYIEPLLSCEYYFEPGRIISNNAMHIILRVVDIKSPTCAILDGGSNIIGWERLTYDYFPVINLTRPSLQEHQTNLYGSLCMASEFDSWGRFYFGSGLEEGDVLMVPYQGCLTYSLAQNFIHPIPPVYTLN